MDNLLQDPAVTYWDEKLSVDGEVPSPRMASLIAAIFDWFKRRDGTEAIRPEAFNCILQAFDRPDFGFDAGSLSISTMNKLATEYYEILAMSYTVDDSHGHFNMPLLSMAGLGLRIMLQLCTAPNATLKTLNKFLANTKLLDLETGEEFTYKCIPNKCLPDVRADMAEVAEEATEQWLEERAKILLPYSEMSTAKELENEKSPVLKTSELELSQGSESTTTDPPGSAKQGTRRNMTALAAEFAMIGLGQENVQVSVPPPLLSTTSSSSTTTVGTGVMNGDEAKRQQFASKLNEMKVQNDFTEKYLAMQQEHMLRMRVNQIENLSYMQAASSMEWAAFQQKFAQANGSATQSWGIW
jgi:hypothetical protein